MEHHLPGASLILDCVELADKGIRTADLYCFHLVSWVKKALTCCQTSGIKMGKV